MNSTVFSFSNIKTEFESILDAETLGDQAPQHLIKACKYALLSGGKRIRPLIVYMMAHSIGKGLDVKEAALSVEYFHTASLIADDLPCMDDDDFRRDKPTLHKVFGESTALLASYALITSAFKQIAKSVSILSKKQSDSEAVGLLALSEAADLAGICGATGGQFEDLFQKPQTLEDLLETIRKKTVTLFQISFIFGWLFGGGDLEKFSVVKKIGFHFGMAFQIADDFQDTKQDQKRLKEVNLVNFIGCEKAKNLFNNQIKELNLLKSVLGVDLEAMNKLQDQLSRIVEQA